MLLSREVLYLGFRLEVLANHRHTYTHTYLYKKSRNLKQMMLSII